MTDKVEELAEGLSEAQRKVLLHARLSELRGVWTAHVSRRRRFFERLGLTRQRWEGDYNYDRLTDLGLAVRQYLKDNQDG